MRHLLSLAVLAALLSGCARFAYEPGPAPDSTVIAEVLARDIDTRPAPQGSAFAALAAVDAPPMSSAALLGLAIANDIEIDARLAALDAALAAPGALARWLNPGVGFTFERHSLRDDVATSDYGIGPEFSVTLRNPLDYAARRAQADARVSAAEALLRERYWELFGMVSRARVRLLAAQAGMALTARELSLLDASVALAEERVALGLSAPLELSLLSLNRNQVRVESLARTQAVTLAERALEQALALPAGALVAAVPDAPSAQREPVAPPTLGTLSAALEPAPVPAMAPLLDAGLTLRADMLVALARYAEADAGVRQAVAAQYPQITLNPGYFFDQGDHVWSLMTGLALPLAANHGPRIEAASKLRTQRRAEFDALQTDVLQQIATARAALAAALTRREALASVVLAMQADRVALETQQTAGVVDPLTLRRAEQQMLRVRYDQIEADLAVLLGAIDLAEAAHLMWWKEASADGDPSDVAKAFDATVNAWLAGRRAAAPDQPGISK